MHRLVYRRKLHLLHYAFRLKDDLALLDVRDIPTRRHAGILFSIVKSNHYKFPKNPQYRCMLEWNKLSVEVSLIKNKEAFSRAVTFAVRNPYAKVL